MIDRVTGVLVDAADLAIVPRFRNLATADVAEKSPGDLVTVADREAERLISEGLRGILDIPVVGEEAVAEDVSLLNALSAPACWLVDPIDGTSNFVAGRSEYAVMAALLHHGDPVAGWILLPETGQVYAAERGSGAFRDGVRIRRSAPPAEVEKLRGAVPTKRLNSDERTELSNVSGRFAAMGPGSLSAGVNYTWLLTEHLDFVRYQRSLPWDHAAGSLLLAESGGVSIRMNGQRYLVSDGRNGPLLNAVDDGCCQRVRAALRADRKLP